MSNLPPPSHFSGIGTQAQIMSKNCHDARLAMAFQYVAIGSVVIMGLAGMAHLIKDIGGTWKHEPASRESRRMREDVDRHDKGHDRGR